MTLILGLMLFGIITGIFTGKYPAIIRLNGRLLNLAIYTLLLLLGIGVGSNEKIISNISSLGSDAIIISLGAIAGSVLVSRLVYRIFFHPG